MKVHVQNIVSPISADSVKEFNHVCQEMGHEHEVRGAKVTHFASHSLP